MDCILVVICLIWFKVQGQQGCNWSYSYVPEELHESDGRCEVLGRALVALAKVAKIAKK